MTEKLSPCIVVYDNVDGICVPMSADPDNPGALCCLIKTVLVFPTRKAAKAAIAISTKYAELHLLLGKPANTDFLPPARKYIKIVDAATVSE